MCGIIGVFTKNGDAVETAFLGLFAVQHRGQDSAGLATQTRDAQVTVQKNMGLLKVALKDLTAPLRAPSSTAIGHLRYPTQGGVTFANAQPHCYPDPQTGRFALASNGDLVNYWSLRRWLELEGITFRSGNDGELLVNLIGYFADIRGMSTEEAIQETMKQAKGAYSAVLLDPKNLWAFRDALGIRPMVIGTLAERAGTVIASESVALDILGAEYEGPFPPGTVMRINGDGLRAYPGASTIDTPTAHCVFELIYFSRPDSIIFDAPRGPTCDHMSSSTYRYVYQFRKCLGAALADAETIHGDVVVPIPDSSNFIALGYAERAGLPFQFGLVRNHYVGRTFIRPEQRYRDADVLEKFNPLPGFFEGKRVIVVDDSIVRGTTMRQIIAMIRNAGAREIHLRIGSPPMRYSCFYGIDTPTREQLIANSAGMEPDLPKDRIEEVVGEFLGVDTLRYLTLKQLREIAEPLGSFCYACFSGTYPAGMKERPEAVITAAEGSTVSP
jgi:amidophosphoribosyltransferase